MFGWVVWGGGGFVALFLFIKGGVGLRGLEIAVGASWIHFAGGDRNQVNGRMSVLIEDESFTSWICLAIAAANHLRGLLLSHSNPIVVGSHVLLLFFVLWAMSGGYGNFKVTNDDHFFMQFLNPAKFKSKSKRQSLCLLEKPNVIGKVDSHGLDARMFRHRP